MEKEIVERLDRIEKLLIELVEIARANWQVDEPKSHSGTLNLNKTKQGAMEPYQWVRSSQTAPDLSDVYDPNAKHYEAENAEIEGEGLPQKGRMTKAKTRKRKLR